MKVEISPYVRMAHYHETDQMGIIHHANYLHWFEEARVDLMEQLGMGYDVMEAHGIYSPVLSVHCDYKSMVRFHDVVLIKPVLTAYTGTRMTVSYTVTDQKTGALRAAGESKHCFLNREGRPVSLRRADPVFDEIFQGILVPKEEK